MINKFIHRNNLSSATINDTDEKIKEFINLNLVLI